MASLTLPPASSVGDRELTNVATLARAVTTAALVRTESRGAHSRVDFPERDETQRRRVIVRGSVPSGSLPWQP